VLLSTSPLVAIVAIRTRYPCSLTPMYSRLKRSKRAGGDREGETKRTPQRTYRSQQCFRSHCAGSWVGEGAPRLHHLLKRPSLTGYNGHLTRLGCRLPADCLYDVSRRKLRRHIESIGYAIHAPSNVDQIALVIEAQFMVFSDID